VSAQHGDLVTEHEDLDVFEQLQRSVADHPDRQTDGGPAVEGSHPPLTSRPSRSCPPIDRPIDHGHRLTLHRR
jgi:hypothetical protein